jgi:hypothetical protein
MQITQNQPLPKETVVLNRMAVVCTYQEGSRMAEALYFAPHFGQAIARNHPGVRVGISYIARIESIEVVESW